MKKVRFIINPISGIGRQKKLEPMIAELLDTKRFDYEISYTKAPGHAIEISREAAEAGFHMVIAVGGDGSVNEVAQGLANSNTAMGIIPAGSGNGLARHLGIPLKMNEALATINNAHLRTIDTAHLNGHRFVVTAGVGFDAYVSWKFGQNGRRGFRAYAQLVMNEFPRYKAKEYEIEVDGKVTRTRAILISIANSAQYGNNASIAPKAKIDDGLLDVCILKPFPKVLTPWLTMRLFNGTIDRSSRVISLQGKEIIIRQSDEIAHIDGEPSPFGRELKIGIEPLSLQVAVPRIN